MGESRECIRSKHGICNAPSKRSSCQHANIDFTTSDTKVLFVVVVATLAVAVVVVVVIVVFAVIVIPASRIGAIRAFSWCRCRRLPYVLAREL